MARRPKSARDYRRPESFLTSVKSKPRKARRLPRRPKKRLILSFKYPLLPTSAKAEMDYVLRGFEKEFRLVNRVVSSRNYISGKWQLREIELVPQPEYDDPEVLKKIGVYDFASIKMALSAS